VNPASKPFTRPENCSFEPITLTSGITCSTFGISFDEGQVRALEQLRLGEQRALEDFFLRRWLAPTVLAGGTDLTPVAGALSMPAGVGVLENWLAVNYGGQGVIHAPAGAAALLSHSRVINIGECGDDCAPQTAMGNCVVLGAGYAANVGPDGTVAPAGEAWLYITPPVRVRRDAPSLTTTTEAQSIRTTTNDRFALAETTMVVEVACCEAAAVRVTLAGC
jgi:hypothetical protein